MESLYSARSTSIIALRDTYKPASRVTFSHNFAFFICVFGATLGRSFCGYYFNSFLILVAGVDTYMVALLFLITNMWDAVTDPLVGFLSDNYPTRFGRRHPWFWLGLPLLPLCLTGLFLHVEVPTGYYLGLFCALKLATTIWMIPMAALTMDAFSTDEDRNSTIVARGLGLGLSAVVAALGAGQVLTTYQFSGQGYFYAAVGLAALAGLCTGVGVPLLPKESAKAADGITFSMIKDILRMKEFRLLVTLQTMMSVAIGIMSNNLQLYVQYSLNLGAFISGAIAIIACAGMLTAPLCKPLVRRIGKKRGYALACLLTLGSSLWFMLLPRGNLAMFYLFSAWQGVAIGLSGFIGYSMMCDLVDYEHSLSGQAKPAVFFATNNFTDKAGIGVGVAAVNALLASLGFNPAQGMVPDHIDFYYRVVMAGSLAGISLIALALLPFYPIDAAFSERVREELALSGRRSSLGASESSFLSANFKTDGINRAYSTLADRDSVDLDGSGSVFTEQ